MSRANAPGVLTLGETMALFDAVDDAVRDGTRWTLRVAGSESNVAIALARLGVPVTWVSRLGTDATGDMVADVLSAEGVDLRFVRRDPASPTGVLLKWREGGEGHVLYHRRGSAASAITPEDAPDQAIDDAALVHLTGITMAIGERARRAVLDVARRARDRAIPVTFDPNHRPALWSAGEAATAQREMLPLVDHYLCGWEEGALLFGASDPEALVDAIRDVGPSTAVVRIGPDGALVGSESGTTHVPPPSAVEVVDEVGAGDGFAAGFIYGVLQGWQADACAHAGNVIAAHALAGTGDWETFPRLADVGDSFW